MLVLVQVELTLLASMKKSELFTAPSDANIALGNMTLDTSLHGLDGPIRASLLA